MIPGIVSVTCVYVNPELQRLGSRFRPSIQSAMAAARSITSEEKQCMFERVLQSCAEAIRVVLMDSWYASMKVIKVTRPTRSTIVLCRNRQATQGPEMPYQRLDTLPFDESEEQIGKLVHLKKFLKGHQVKLFRLVSSTGDTEWIVTNDLSEALPPQSASRQRYAGRSSSFIANGNKPPSKTLPMPKTKSPTQSHHEILNLTIGLGPSFIKQQWGQNNGLRPQAGITG